MEGTKIFKPSSECSIDDSSELEVKTTAEMEAKMLLSETPHMDDGANAPFTSVPPPPSVQITRKKGYALIISNGLEKEKDVIRKDACKEDLQLMEKLWKTKLGCTLHEDRVHANLTAEEMKRKITDFAQLRVECEYLVLYISTHGGYVLVKRNDEPERYSTGFYGEDLNPVSEDELMHYFRNGAGNHQGVTKFFILDYKNNAMRSKKAKPSTNGDNITSRPPFPLHSEIVTIYANQGNSTSQSSKSSLLTASLYDVFEKNWKTQSLIKMLTMVNKRMKKESEHHVSPKPMSIFESSLGNEFTFYKAGDEQICHEE